MRGGALPPALLCAALGFALAFAPRRTWPTALGLLIGAAVLLRWLNLGASLPDAAFLACWASVALTALTLHLPGGVGPRLAAALSLNAGIWIGAVTSAAGQWADLAIAIPCVLVVFPAAWLDARGHTVVVKVVGSWLIAVAVLSAGLSFVPTPGYVPDHME